MANMPLRGRRSESLLAKVAGRELPQWAAEMDSRSWAQLFLESCLSRPAVTCAILGTTKVKHPQGNLAAARGRMLDATLRRKLEQHWDTRA